MMMAETKRKRWVWQFALANFAALIFLLVLSFRPGVPISTTIILGVVFLLIVNGALLLGLRIGQAQRRGSRLSRPVWCFGLAACAALYATFEIASKDYASAGEVAACGVVAVALGLLARRENAKKDVGGSERQ